MSHTNPLPELPRPFVPGDEFNPRNYYTADQMREYAAAAYHLGARSTAAQPVEPTCRATIRKIFLAHGFTIKEGHDDLKPYVYEAAEALMTLAAQTAGLLHQAPAPRPEPEAAWQGRWQPIETAPENMDRAVLVGWLDEDGDECLEFDITEDGCWQVWHNNAEHVEIIGGHGVSYTPPYTHWMPTLPLPQAASQQADLEAE